jgi:hypothetical protein
MAEGLVQLLRAFLTGRGRPRCSHLSSGQRGLHQGFPRNADGDLVFLCHDLCLLVK